MKRTILASMVALVAVGCATTQQAQMGPDDAIAARQRLMKSNGANWSDIQNKAKAGSIEAIGVNAETLALQSMQIASLFPEGSLNPAKSAAKPEIWQKWPEYTAAAKNMQVLAEKLRDTARSKNADATQAMLKDFGRQACGTCHTPFRVPPKQ